MRVRWFAAAVISLFALQASAGERVYVSKMGGDIHVDDATSGATLRTMGGDIRIGRSGSDVVAKTMGGDIEVRQLSGDLDAGSMGGSIRIRVAGGSGSQQITLKSMGGQIELTVPRDFDATFDVEVRESTIDDPSVIDSDIPLTVTHKDEWTFWHGRQRIVTATKTHSTSMNRVEISTHGSRVVIRHE